MSAPSQAQRDAWNGDSGHRWVADADRRDAVLAPVGDAVLGAAALRPGDAVLDVGCGCGATTIATADAVAPGRVLGIDLSEPMLGLARQRAGDRHITFLQADAQTHRFASDSFDVVIARFGTMFFDDPVAAFTNIAHAMRPGGRLCLGTWQRLEANDWLLVPGAALLRYGQLPESASDAAPGMFAQADPDRVRAVLAAAGWTGIDVTPVHLERRLGNDASDALDYLTGTGVARAVLDTIDPAERSQALDDVVDVLADYEGADGVRLGCGVNLITATASATP